MKKTFFTKLFLWCIVLGFTLTTVAQESNSNIGKVPSSSEKHNVNYTITSDPLGGPTAYGHSMTLGSFVSMPMPAGTPFTTIGPMDAPAGEFYGSACFGPGGIYYIMEQTIGGLNTVDLGTGVVTPVGPTGVADMTGLTFDPSSGTFFGSDLTSLYTVDPATGAATLVGPIGNAGANFIDISSDCDGNLYGYDVFDDTFYSVDPATGAGTAIGVLGFDASFGQGSSFDNATGILYLSSFNVTSNTGQLRTVDLATGLTTLVFDWGFEQIAPFAINTTCGAPCPIGPPSNPDPPDGSTGWQPGNIDLFWTNGTGADSICVFFDGSLVYSGMPITGLSVVATDFSTPYSWRVDGKNDTCLVFGPNWTFTTKDDPNILCEFMDDFEAGLVNWTITNNGGTCDWIQFCPPFPNTYTLPATATGCLMDADADECGDNTTLFSTATLNFVTDATQGPGYQTVWIEWDNDWFAWDSKDEAYVEYSIDGGTTWNILVSWLGVDQRDTHEVWPVPGAGMQPDIRFRLRVIQPDWDWWWVVDNFGIYIADPLPVELTSFAATVNESDVNLNWTTATETNNMGFEVQRSSNRVEYSRIAFVEGHGTVSEAQNYVYSDKNLEVGTYTYRLKQTDLDGTSEFSEAVEVEVIAPNVYTLEQNYPNPFNPSTKIEFSLAVDSKVTLTVFDVLGQEVVTLINGNLSAGSHDIDFKAISLNSGVYLYRIDARGVDGVIFTSVKKMILAK